MAVCGLWPEVGARRSGGGLKFVSSAMQTAAAAVDGGDTQAPLLKEAIKWFLGDVVMIFKVRLSGYHWWCYAVLYVKRRFFVTCCLQSERVDIAICCLSIPVPAGRRSGQRAATTGCLLAARPLAPLHK